jgi:LysM repeat protein
MRQLLFFILLASPFLSKAYTGDSLNYLTPKDTIFLSIGYFGEKYFIHEMAPKQTLYSLARFYGLSTQELLYFNPGLQPTAVKVGSQVRVPIPNRAIKRYKTDGFIAEEHVPVYYMVKKGDTMYRIAKQHFRMPVETVMQRNQLFDHTLKPDQLLHMGWLSMQGIPDSLRKEVAGPLERRNRGLRKSYYQQLGKKKEYESQGVAAWTKEHKEKSDFYALHRSAPINSIISVHNPMNRRTVYVKVIGRIPDRAYKDDVVVVLSPLSAELLGALDPRFFVRIKYHR